jgi:hypothetical protein
MNTVEVNATLSGLPVNRVADVIDLKQRESSAKAPVIARGDIYSSSTQNVAAKVLSFSIAERFQSTMGANAFDMARRPVSVNSQSNELVFDVERVAQNVMNFVSTSLRELAVNGADTDDLAYFKAQAAIGVESGVEQAKAELSGIASDDLMHQVTLTEKSILEGIEKLSTDPLDYIQAKASVNSSDFEQISLQTKRGDEVRISFGDSAFSVPSESVNERTQSFTTQTSNLSFTLSGNLNQQRTLEIADLINRVDDLANSFYRSKMNVAYDKSLALGFDSSEIKSLAAQKANEVSNATKTYGDVKHFNEGADRRDLSSPKAVVEYVSKLMNVMDSANQSFDSLGQYNEIINGIVNQMTDVQVPDLVQAINRFHSFNSKFVDSTGGK